MALYPENQRGPEAATELLRSEVKRLGDVVRSQNIRVSQ
jgi:hypothetical protein